MTTITPEIAIVAAWHDALNSGDLDTLVALTHPDVELDGPRGSSVGAALVREWAAHAGITLEPHRWFAQDTTVVVAQTARWRDPESDAPSPPHAIATTFRLRDGLIAHIARYDDLPTALIAADLTPSNECHRKNPIKAD